MGADLLGYITLIPYKLTDKEIKECEKHLNDLENLLKNPDFICKIASEESSDAPMTKALQKLSPRAVYEMEMISYNGEDIEELEDLFENILELIPQAKSFIHNPTIESRDTCWRSYRILGRNFLMIFAGDTSWGDEPQGEGYETLKMIDMVGILSKIEEMTIPSESLSIQMIKGSV